MWREAEEVIGRITNADEQAEALSGLASSLAQGGQWKHLFRLVQHWWLRAKTRDEAIELLPIAYYFISHNPELGMAFFNSFSWVDEFLQGK
jgi:hypothetical protein